MVPSRGLSGNRDAVVILAHRRKNGAHYWASADGRWGVGSPFSTLGAGLMPSELGMKASDPIARGIADLLFACQEDDGRIRPGPRLPVQPCVSIQAPDGGWRCSVLKYGAGPDTDASNPGVTLFVLDAFRFRPELIVSAAAKRAGTPQARHSRAAASHRLMIDATHLKATGPLQAFSKRGCSQTFRTH